MKDIKKLLSLVMVVMFMACMTSCGSDDEPSNGGSSTESKLVGTWKSSDGDALTLKSDRTGTLTISGYGSTSFKGWHLQGSQLLGTSTSGSDKGREILIVKVENFDGKSFYDSTVGATWQKK